MGEQSSVGAEETPAGGDLPYVDGKATTSEELRAEIVREADPQVRRIEELRGDLAATVEELGGRLDVRPRISRYRSGARRALMPAAVLLAAVVLGRRLRSHREGPR